MSGNGGRTRTEQPLSDVVICCTSVAAEQRTQYADFALQMGADHKLDLTSDVTHLLVGDTNTPKYKYVAREREDVKVLRPDWIEAVRDAYMADDGIDMTSLEEQYRLPTLAGLTICITGFDDLSLRTQLQQRIDENGGNYVGDLTKTVTHLIAFKPEGKKYQYATQWQKNVVTLNWLNDSLERGMQLEETLYHPTITSEDQGKGAWNREAKTANHLRKRSLPEEPNVGRSRKLRRTASAKLSSHNDGMWADISGNSGTETSAREALRPSKSMTAIEAQFTAVTGLPESAYSEAPGSEHPGAVDKQPHRVPFSHGYMDGNYFYCNNFDARGMGILRNVLLGEGATILQSLDELLDLEYVPAESRFVLVPHNVKPLVATTDERYEVVTELWVDACVDRKESIVASTYPLGRPVSRNNAFANLKINTSGFRGIELNNVAKVVRATGASYEEVLKPGVSVLICNSADCSLDKRIDKIRHAKVWEIAVVPDEWLWASLKAGVPLPLNSFAIKTEATIGHVDIPARLPRTHVRDSFGVVDQTTIMPQGQKSKLPIEEIPTQPLPKKKTVEAEGMRIRPGSDFSNRPGAGMCDERQVKVGKVANKTHWRRVQRVEEHDVNQEKPLKETNGNSPTKARSVSPKKKKSLFQSLDGPTSGPETNQNNDGSTNISRPPSASTYDSQTLNDEIHDLLSHTGRSRALNSSDLAAITTKEPLSRAPSNVSNASVASRARASRAGSVSSVNTDGLGSEVPVVSTESGRPTSSTRRRGTFVGRAKAREDSMTKQQAVPIPIHEPNLYHNDSVDEDEEETAPRSTQLGYAETDEAIALRAKLAEKRRNMARAGQEKSSPEESREKVQSPRRIRDDDSILDSKRGAGRRTRQSDRTPPELRKLNDF